MTEEQKDAFGFAGTNPLWIEICNILNQMKSEELFVLIDKNTRGEDRIHAAGRVDGINMVMDTLAYTRQRARVLNGLTPDEKLS